MIMAWTHRVLSILLLVNLVYCTTGRRGGVPVPTLSLKPPSLDRVHSKTTYSCEGKDLNVGCEEGLVIHLIRANYGRFSISMCNDHGHVDWSVNCMSYKSFLIMQDKCSQKQSCGIIVSSSIFGDPCPGTLKYLEVQYHCVSPSFFTSTTRKPTVLSNNTGDVDIMPETTQSPVPETPASTEATAATPTTMSSTSPSPAAHISSTSTTVRYPQHSVASLVTSTQRSMTKAPTTTPSTTTTSTFQPSTVSTVPPNHCPPTLMSDIQWNWTKAGTQAIQRCPGGATGLARWQCASDPTRWATSFPDLRECRSGWVINLKN